MGWQRCRNETLFWNFPLFLSTSTVSSWAGIYGMFALLILWVSYSTDLLATWYSELAAAQVPWLYLFWDTPAHNICQNMWPRSILSPSVPCLLPLHINPPPSLPLSWILEQRHKGNIKLTVTDFFFVLFCFINEILQVDVCEHSWKIQTRRNVSNPAVECDGMFKKLTSSSRKYKRKTNLNDIGSSPETLSRYGRARLLPANTRGLVKVVWILADLKHVLVFQLHWLLGRLFELLIKLCEHSGRPCWDVFVSWVSAGRTWL